MGKQICFFITENDVNQLTCEVKINGGTIINEDGYELNDSELSNIADEGYCRNRFKYPYFFIKLKTSKLIFDYYDEIDRKCINQLFSETIQFKTCMPSHRNVGWFEHGRFWYEPRYYDKKGLKVSKSKELDVLFNNLSRFIKKNYRLTADKFAYIGPDAYQKYQQGNFIPCSLLNQIKV